MKGTHSGFSLVELLVVSIILTLLSVFSISTFQTNRQEQAIQDELGLISQTIKNLDNQVGIQLVDYQITFMSGGYYLVEENTHQGKSPLEVSYSGSIFMIRGNSNMLFSLLSQDNIVRKSYGMIRWEVQDHNTYDISGCEMNTCPFSIQIKPFSIIDMSNEITLQSIEDGSGTLYSTGKIQNSYQGTKRYIFSGTTLTPPLIFHFLVNGDALEYVLEK